MIILDEVDYMGEGDIEAIMPILMTTPDTVFVAASTPSGRKSYSTTGADPILTSMCTGCTSN
jgi:hypothetical protein